MDDDDDAGKLSLSSFGSICKCGHGGATVREDLCIWLLLYKYAL